MSEFTERLKAAFSTCAANALSEDDRQIAGLAMSLYLNRNEDVENLLNSSVDKEKLWKTINKAVHLVRGEGYVYTHHGIQRCITSWLSPEVQKEVFGRLQKLLEKIQSEFGVPAYVTSGTLLGIVRDGALISHDDDIDAAYVSFAKDYLSWALEWQALIEFINRVPGCSAVRHLPGLMRVSLELESRRKVEFDLFSSLREGSYVNEYPLATGELREEEVLPLRRITFLDAQIPIPKIPEALLRVNYGENWRVPDPTFRFDWSRAEVQYTDKLVGMSKFVPSASWVRSQLPVDFGDFEPGSGVDFSDYKISALKYLVQVSSARRLLVFGAQSERLLSAAKQEMDRVGGSLVVAELDSPLDEKFGAIGEGEMPYFPGFPGMASNYEVVFGDEDAIRRKFASIEGGFDAVYLDTSTRSRTLLACELIGPAMQHECHVAFDDFILEMDGVFYSGQYQAAVMEGCFNGRSMRPLGRSRWSQVVMRTSEKLQASHLMS